MRQLSVLQCVWGCTLSLFLSVAHAQEYATGLFVGQEIVYVQEPQITEQQFYLRQCGSEVLVARKHPSEERIGNLWRLKLQEESAQRYSGNLYDSDGTVAGQLVLGVGEYGEGVEWVIGIGVMASDSVELAVHPIGFLGALTASIAKWHDFPAPIRCS